MRSAAGAAALAPPNPHARDPWHPDAVNLRTTALPTIRIGDDDEASEEVWTNPLRPPRPEVSVTLNPSVKEVLTAFFVASLLV